jgi:glutamyl-tRNA reductase
MNTLDAAVRVAQRIFDLRDARVLLLGNGRKIRMAARRFSAHHPRAVMLAAPEDVAEQFQHFDIVVSCVARPIPVIDTGLVMRAARVRRHRPMFIVDLAMPRDVEPEVDRLPDIFLYTAVDLDSTLWPPQH